MNSNQLKLATCLKLDIREKKWQSSHAECQWHTQSQDALGVRLTDLDELPFFPHPSSTFLITLTRLQNKNWYNSIKDSPLYSVNTITIDLVWNLYLNLHFKHSNLIYKAKKGWDQLLKPVLATHTLCMLWKPIHKPGILLHSTLD